MRATFVSAKALTPRNQLFHFRPERPMRYLPGQYADLHLPHAGADNRGERREFTLVSLPGEPIVSIATNFAFENGSTYKRQLQNLCPGDEVTFAEPMGDFVLPKDPTIPLVFVARGIGSAPYAAMVRWLHARDERRNIQLIYSTSSPNELAFSDLWHEYPLDFIPIMSRHTTDWSGETGRLTTEKILQLAAPVDSKLIYLAGPQSLIEPIYYELQAAGVPRPQLLLDYFPGY